MTLCVLPLLLEYSISILSQKFSRLCTTIQSHISDGDILVQQRKYFKAKIEL